VVVGVVLLVIIQDEVLAVAVLEVIALTSLLLPRLLRLKVLVVVGLLNLF
jgi:hypothetical protein